MWSDWINSELRFGPFDPYMYPSLYWWLYLYQHSSCMNGLISGFAQRPAWRITATIFLSEMPRCCLSLLHPYPYSHTTSIIAAVIWPLLISTLWISQYWINYAQLTLPLTTGHEAKWDDDPRRSFLPHSTLHRYFRNTSLWELRTFAWHHCLNQLKCLVLSSLSSSVLGRRARCVGHSDLWLEQLLLKVASRQILIIIWNAVFDMLSEEVLGIR